MSSQPSMTAHDLALIRRAVLTVIDDGCDCASGEKHPWEFYEDMDTSNPDAFTEDNANQSGR